MGCTAAVGAATAITAAMAAAASAVRTADALFAAFLGLPDVEGRAADDGSNNSDHKKIDRIHILLPSSQGIFRLDLLVRTDTQPHQHCHIGHQEDQAAHKARAQGAGGDQRADLVDQEANGVAGGQLQGNTTSSA